MNEEHSNVCGGSSAERRYYCVASRALEEKAPKTTSEFAERGSMLHGGIELIQVNFPENMKEAKPHIQACIGKDFGFDYAPIDHDLVETKIRPAMEKWFEIREQYDLDDWIIETRVSLESIIPGAFGKADIVAIDTQKRLHILDWKFGDGVMVPAEENKGLMFYAGAALNDEDPDMQDFLKDVYDDTPVFLHIVQPTDRGGEIHDVWETTVEHIETFVDDLAEAIAASYAPDAQPKAGDYCRWCSAAYTCPATKQLVGATAKKKIEGMDAAELGKFLTQLQMVVALKEKAFSHAQKQLESGHVIPGWKLVQKRATRQWVDPDKVRQICRKAKMKKGEYTIESLKSPAQMEKVNKAVYTKKLSELVHSQASGLTIAPDTDKRPAVVGSVELLANALPAKADS